ncbi:MAG TPA: cobalamin biosynthesis protein [Solirubrobacterales bacterium]|nr:cobalamin biosynthesis protein [Solirubrobacterales bacterium]
MSGGALAVGYGADLVLGDPRRGHPVAGFGRLAAATEERLYAPSRRNGAAYAAVLVGLAALGGELAARLCRRLGAGEGPALAAVCWVALGGRSLVREAERVAGHLDRGDLEAARATLPALVGRDPSRLDEAGICRATVESVAENTGDAVLAPLFWGALAGPAGIAAYRAANTLDAMVGNRSERYLHFGWAAARLDDGLNLAPARLGAGLTALCAPLVGGSPASAWAAVRRDAGAHPSPNAGQLEAAFAGALGLRLGGPLAYNGRVENRPPLGDGRAPGRADVHRAARLSLVVGVCGAALCAVLRSRTRGGRR